MCDAERFCTALQIIADECHLTGITYNKLGIIKFHFSDGSTVGGLAAWKEAGIITY